MCAVWYPRPDEYIRIGALLLFFNTFCSTLKFIFEKRKRNLLSQCFFDQRAIARARMRVSHLSLVSPIRPPQFSPSYLF